MIDILGYLVYIINPLTIIMATTYSIGGIQVRIQE